MFYRLLEWLLIFVGVPLVFYFELVSVPKIAALLLITALGLGLLWFDDSFKFRTLVARPRLSGIRKRLIVRSTLVALSVFGLVTVLDPDQLFRFPIENVLFWGVIMLLYPILSALPQEFLYRAFFFHRYKKLFPSDLWMTVASAGSFTFLHIVYDNPWALLLSFIGGILFARTYRKTQSLCWVSIEHAIYGWIIFTLGMGRYFYEPF